MTGQDHTIDLNMAEVPVATRDMHPTPYSTTAAVYNTHPQTDTVEDTLTEIPHMIKDETRQLADTLHAEATLATTALTAVVFAQGNPLVLPVVHIQGRHQIHIHRQKPLKTPVLKEGHYSGFTVGDKDLNK